MSMRYIAVGFGLSSVVFVGSYLIFLETSGNCLAANCNYSRMVTDAEGNSANTSARVAELTREVKELQQQVSTHRNPPQNALGAEIARLRQGLSALGERVDTITSGAQSEALLAMAPSSDISNDDISDIDLLNEELERKDAAEAERLMSTFTQESVDQAWSAEAVDMIHNVMNDASLSDLNYSEVECRSSQCRFRIDGMGAGEEEEFQFGFMPQISDRFPTIDYLHEEHADGTSSMVMYLTAASD